MSRVPTPTHKIPKDSTRLPDKAVEQVMADKTDKSEHPVQNLLSVRGKTHGKFKDTAVLQSFVERHFYQVLNKQQVRSVDNEYVITGINMIHHKLCRIKHGDKNFRDHYLDLEGYAELSVFHFHTRKYVLERGKTIVHINAYPGDKVSSIEQCIKDYFKQFCAECITLLEQNIHPPPKVNLMPPYKQDSLEFLSLIVGKFVIDFIDFVDKNFKLKEDIVI